MIASTGVSQVAAVYNHALPATVYCCNKDVLVGKRAVRTHYLTARSSQILGLSVSKGTGDLPDLQWVSRFQRSIPLEGMAVLEGEI